MSQILLSRNGEGITVLTLIYIYASLERLVQSLERESRRKSELVSHFVRGFNSISGRMNFVDIGDEGGLMSEKLTGLVPKFPSDDSRRPNPRLSPDSWLPFHSSRSR